jgi:hypothetical protein
MPSITPDNSGKAYMHGKFLQQIYNPSKHLHEKRGMRPGWTLINASCMKSVCIVVYFLCSEPYSGDVGLTAKE